MAPLASQQWGFRQRRSTVSALLDATFNWAQAIDGGNEVCAIFFDLRKAFDSVPHRMLIEKLRKIGLNEHLVQWIFSYLYECKQYVVLAGEQSTIKPVLSGVPQGSVLGPLLFILYVDDLADELVDCGTSFTLYADDILLHRVIDDPSDYSALQDDISTLSNWVLKKNLTLNPSKCKFLVISKLRKNSVPVPTLTLYDQPLERVSSYRYLGVNISEDLTWSTHLN